MEGVINMNNKVSVIIPAFNEQKTIAKVIKRIKTTAHIAEILVVDNNSTDKTAICAEKAGAKVIFCAEKGKGYAMEKGLKEAANDIIVFIDADINNYSSNLISKLVDPILEGRADFVKSMFDRKGGRVTELVAKPMLKLLFPEIQTFSQPLSGMIAGKKHLFNKLTFEKDYGVDIGILLDMILLNVNIEEVHIGTINNFSQDWKNLDKMSYEVMSAIVKRSQKNNDI